MILAFNHSELKPIDPIAFELFRVPVYWYGIMLMLGALLAYLFSQKTFLRFGITQDQMTLLLIGGIVFGVIGARIWYVAFEWSTFKNDLSSIFDLRTGGLAIHGVVIAVVLYLLIYSKINKRIKMVYFLELLAVGFLIGQVVGRWGNFINQEAHGGLVPGANLDEQRAWLFNLGLPEFIVNQMYISKLSDVAPEVGYYHPTFLYELLWNFCGLMLIVGLRRIVDRYYVGDGMGIYLIWYGVGRFFVEILRTDPLMIGGIKVAQLTSIIGVVLGILWLVLRRVFKFQLLRFKTLEVEHV